MAAAKKFAVYGRAKFSSKPGPYLCGTYKTMNGCQMFIPVSDSSVDEMDMKAPHDCRDPPLNTHIANLLFRVNENIFISIPRSSPFLVCLSAI